MPADEAVRTWERALPLKYVLVSEEWDGELIVWARCADTDGLFLNPYPRRERLTLMGCTPTGRLRKAGERAWHRSGVPDGPVEPVDLGEFAVIVDFPQPGAAPEAEPFDAYDAHHWELCHRPQLIDGCPAETGLTIAALTADITGSTRNTALPAEQGDRAMLREFLCVGRKWCATA